MGTDLNQVSQALERELRTVGYTTTQVRLSARLSTIDRFRGLRTTPLETYYEEHMKAGTELRKDTGMNEAMAALGIGVVRDTRTARTPSPVTEPPVVETASGEAPTNEAANTEQDSVAYVFRSIKRTEEVDLLRQVYGNRFFLISAYSPRDARVVNLAGRIAESHHDAKPDNYRHIAERLIQTDESEDDLGVSSGQDVRGAFPLADIFIDASSPKETTSGLRRFVEALFGYQFHTPTIGEYGMYLAYAAAWRSADLARQVGAAILTPTGSVLALGPNDVPRARGGLYWPDDENDDRDFHHNEDSGFTGRRRMLADLLVRLQSAKWLSAERSEMNTDELVDEALNRDIGGLLRDSQLMDVIEFGRSVHAEMAAITDAAMRGVALAGATLYCTTFPCHMCARHIVSAGITKVVYVEPYPKSLAAQLYRDSISVDSPAPLGDRVAFLPYVGVGVTLYPRLFAADLRKDARGKVIPWTTGDAIPRIGRVDRMFPDREVGAFESLSTAMQKHDLRFVEGGADGANDTATQGGPEPKQSGE